MKNVAIIKTTFVALTLCALFVACSGLSTNTTETASSGAPYTISGRILTGSTSGATSSAVLRALSPAQNDARSATSSLSFDYSTLTLQAMRETTTEIQLAPVSGTVSSDGSYVIALPVAGTWHLVAYAAVRSDDDSEDAYILSGMAEVSVDEAFTTKSDVGITVTPVTSSNKTGSISLTMQDATTDVLIKTVSFDVVSGGEESASIEAIDFTELTGTLEQSSFPAGNHEVILSFYDERGNVLYTCKEVITVFSGFTTDTWFGTSPHMQATADGSYSFVITDELIESYGTDAVPDTDMLLYSVGTDGVKYYLSSDTDTAICTSLSTAADSFCFDADGYYYILTKATEASSDGATSATYKLCTNNKTMTFADEGVFAATGDITIDRKTNAFYMLVQSTLAKRPDYITSGSVDTYTYALMDGETVLSTTPAAYAIYNDVLYIPVLVTTSTSSDGNEYAIILKTADLSEASSIADSAYSVSLASTGLVGTFTANNPVITDCLYQDGAVYVLLREVSATGNNSTDLAYYSRGALLRCDVHFGTVQTVIPFSDSVKSGSDFADVKVGLYYQGNYQIFEDTGTTPFPLLASSTYSWTYGSTTYTVSDCIPALYTPNALETSTTHEPVFSPDAFYGPVKFIAVKPRKLVIADDGLAFYTDADGVLKYKNVNRVVTVDLESFAITASASSATFDVDDSSVKSFICGSMSTTFQSAFSSLLTNATRYYNEDGTWKEVDYASYMWAGIPCGD